MRLDFLTPEEIFAITRRRRHKSQLKALRDLGFTARPDGDGAPLVLRARVEAKFGIHHDGKAATEPDWTYLDAKKTARPK